MITLCFTLIRFWTNHPSLFFGVSFLLGLYAHLTHSFLLIIPCFFLWLPFLILITTQAPHLLTTFTLNVLIFLTGWIYVSTEYSFPLLPDQGITGTAHIKIKSIHWQQSWFGHRWIYRCELHQWIADHPSFSLASSLPCLMVFSEAYTEKYPRPPAKQDYWVSGRLIQRDDHSYILKSIVPSSWKPIPHSWSWAEYRYQWKQKMIQWIETHLSNPLSASFLAGLVTGEFNQTWMREQFARFGLQHLLAISGFHFAIFASFLSCLLNVIFNHRVKVWILLISLGGYCFFLGAQASILRAWIMSSLALMSGLLHKQPSPLNSFGFALWIVSAYDPLFCLELAFQLSFGITAAILLFYPTIHQVFLSLLPKRPLSEVIQMNSWHQHGYCIVVFLRQGLALTLAIHLFAFPLVLYYFEVFPWMSLLYNLFFPFLVSLSLCLLLLAASLCFIPFLADQIHQLNNLYTSCLLQLTYQIPTEIDMFLKWDGLSPFWLIVYLSFALLMGILCYPFNSQTT
jgi:competence protein ComEC